MEKVIDRMDVKFLGNELIVLFDDKRYLPRIINGPGGGGVGGHK